MSSLLRTYKRANQQIKRKAAARVRRQKLKAIRDEIKRRAQEKK